MKLRNFLALALVALCTVSCSDDDDEVLDEIVKPAENIAAQIAGSYEGGNLMTVGGQPAGVVKGTVKITAQEDGKATVELPGSTMGKMVLSAITLTDVEVKSVSDKEFTLEHAEFAMSVDGKEYVNTKGLKGSVKDGKLSLAYDIKPGAMPFPIEFNFTMDATEIMLAQVAGSYKGGNIMKVGGSAIDVIMGAVKISAQENGKVTVVLPEAGMGKMKLAAITLEDVEVKSVSDKEFTLEHGTFEVTIDGTKYVNTKGLKGSLKDGKLSLTYDIKPGAMPFPIEFNFTMDDNEILAGQVARSYKGATEMFMGGESSGSFEAAVEIKAQEDGKFSVILPESKVMGGKMILPSVTVKDVEVKAVADAEGEFTVEAAAFTVEAEGGKNCVNKKGMKGSIKNGALTLEYDLQIGKMPFAIDFKFASAK